ncbi:YbhB/YbcL family Raf kinase inhibitor-like protein [Paenibacillus sp. FSL R5-0519]|uniref:YbhB/YbcL family Raf kinase inhibitor-like protein n=1 Tax=Paenibacillus sp. FSL R5-0519 TaxID=2921648 RepID=UPI0030D9BC36
MRKTWGLLLLTGVLLLSACSQTHEQEVATKTNSTSESKQTAEETQAKEAKNDPFYRMPQVADFDVKSSDIGNDRVLKGEQMSAIFGVEGGKDISPELTWSGAPEGTKSFAVTMYDPDAPTGSGFWHWAVVNIPADVTSIPTSAGDEGGVKLPDGAIQLPNDARAARYIGAAPPAGDGPHRYYIVVHALDVEDIGVKAEDTPAFLGFNMLSHTLGRAVIEASAEVK